MAEPRLSVDEASEAYVADMRNPGPRQLGVCSICRAFVASTADRCNTCRRQPNYLDAVTPITYSVHGRQMHTALRGYKDDPEPSRRYPRVRLAAILWRFLRLHGTCVAAATGVERFDVVTVVPSSTPAGDEVRSGLREMVGWCDLVNDRLRRALRPTGRVQSEHRYDRDRFEAVDALHGLSVLLIEDTWASGATAQSAGFALKAAGASQVGLVVIGRHVRPDWVVMPGETSQQRWSDLPRRFNWNICCLHSEAQATSLLDP